MVILNSNFGNLLHFLLQQNCVCDQIKIWSDHTHNFVAVKNAEGFQNWHSKFHQVFQVTPVDGNPQHNFMFVIKWSLFFNCFWPEIQPPMSRHLFLSVGLAKMCQFSERICNWSPIPYTRQKLRCMLHVL